MCIILLRQLMFWAINMLHTGCTKKFKDKKEWEQNLKIKYILLFSANEEGNYA